MSSFNTPNMSVKEQTIDPSDLVFTLDDPAEEKD